MWEVPNTQERYSSHVPALALLMSMGWEFLGGAEVQALRGSEREVLLEPVLRGVLARRRFEYRGGWYALSEASIDQVVRAVRGPGLNEGLLRANERVYDLLRLGVTVTEFMEDGRKHAVTVRLIDWEDMGENRFHVAEEFSVLSEHGTHTRRPDVVMFVNGIPLGVLEAKRAESGNQNKSMVAEGISQMLRNQGGEYIPRLFIYAQLLFAVSGTEAMYGTTMTPAKFWAVWREEDLSREAIEAVKNRRLSVAQREALFAGKSAAERSYFEGLWSGRMLASEQDELLVSLGEPGRFLEFVRYFLIYEGGKTKIAARYQQVFGVRRLLQQLEKVRPDGGREGGVVWHTTGSGKSFTMVFLCKALLLSPALQENRVIVVTDRLDLEAQLSGTFLASGAFGLDVPGRAEGEEAIAKTGRELAQRIGHGQDRILFTGIQRFASATKLAECFNPSDQLIVLIDEGHRSQGGENHQRMRKALPNAAYIAFTGTPLLKEEKTTEMFGKIVHAYTMQRAVDDGAVTPLLYEERRVELDIHEKTIDGWFDKITKDLNDEQKHDLKRKFATTGTIYGSQKRIDLIALDISEHFEKHVKSQGLKGQLACDSKLSAIRYKRALDALGMVTSRIVISPPDTREGHESVDDAQLPEVLQWWKENVREDARTYEKAVVQAFATDGEPDLLIVVDKLLTGFDEPRNAVLYIDKPLAGHNLLQAIARVNRLHTHKQYGFLIDYRGVLQELDTTIREYQDLEERTQGGYDIADLAGLYANVSTEYKRLPRLHEALWDIFAEVENRVDREQYRQVLMPSYEKDADGMDYDVRQSVREDFYEALTEFGMCLKVALSSRSFFEDASFCEDEIERYKRDLRWFMELRQIARRDAQETVDYSAYEKQLQRIVDQEVTGAPIEDSNQVIVVDALGKSPENWSEDKARNEAAKIQTRLKKTIRQELADDPYAQKVFSQLLREAIEQAEALFDYPGKQYLLFERLAESVDARRVPGEPDFGGNRRAQSYYGVLKMALEESYEATERHAAMESLIAEAYQIDQMVSQAVTENSLNPSAMEQAVRRRLLPYFMREIWGGKKIEIEQAKQLTDAVIGVVRKGRGLEA